MQTSDDFAELRPKSGGSARIIMVLGITLPMAFGAGVALGQYLFGSSHAAAAPVASAKPKAEPAPSAAPPPTVPELAASGDYKAIDQLKAKTPDQRTVEETLSLARGRSHNKNAALEGFGKEIQKKSDLLTNKDQLARLRDFLNDRETTNQAAAIIVALPGDLGPDLLYEVVSAAKKPTETSDLAEELLATKEVREKASAALTLTLDMRKAEECEAFKALLPKAAEVGDRRAMPMLAKATKKKGCGPNKQDDCYECIRPLEKDKDAIDLVDAIKAVQKRAPPKH